MSTKLCKSCRCVKKIEEFRGLRNPTRETSKCYRCNVISAQISKRQYERIKETKPIIIKEKKPRKKPTRKPYISVRKIPLKTESYKKAKKKELDIRYRKKRCENALFRYRFLKLCKIYNAFEN